MMKNKTNNIERNITIYRISDINFDRLIYLNPAGNSSTKLIHIKYNDEKHGKLPLLIQLPDIYMIDDIIEPDLRYVTHELVLPLICRTTDETRKLKKFFDQLDNKIVQDIKKNNDNWKNIFDFNNIKYKYKSFIRSAEGINNSIYDNGIIKLKFLKLKGFQTMVFNKNKQLINPSNYGNTFIDGCYVGSIVEIVSIWINKDIIGLDIRPHQIRVSSGPAPMFILNNNSFDNSDTSSEEFYFDATLDKIIDNNKNNNTDNNIDNELIYSDRIETITDLSELNNELVNSYKQYKSISNMHDIFTRGDISNELEYNENDYINYDDNNIDSSDDDLIFE